MLGQVIHGYRIDQALSGDKGGFGDVYFATHVDSGAQAVVKVLKAEMSAQREIVARFFNEARAAASVHHPGIVQIHNAGYHGDRAYLLMERLYGEDLETRLRNGPLPVDRAIAFLRQTAGAIGAAHDRGIVHRDLKPANLFVVPDPDVVGGERVRVLDFGIAKLSLETDGRKTQGVFGTPAYMSPEQCASTGAVDPRADLYSLGCIFYELVAGRPPFGHGGLELVASHLRDTPQPPRALAPWLPPAVEQVILRLLEKQPAQRYPSCAALIAALDEAAAASGLAVPPAARTGPIGTPVSLGGGGTWRPAAPVTTLGTAAGSATVLPDRRRLGAWIGAGIVLCAAGAIALLVVPARHPHEPVGTGSGGSAVAVASPDAGTPALAGPDAAPADATEIAAVPVDAAQRASATGGASGPPLFDQRTQATGGPHDVAEALNEKGKEYMYAQDYEHARIAFSQAVARVPEVKYLINLATADLQLGYLEAVADPLRAALQASPTLEQQTKIHKLFGVLARQAEQQGREIRPPISAADLGQPGDPPPPTADAPHRSHLLDGGTGRCNADERVRTTTGIGRFWTCAGASRYICDERGNKVTERCAGDCIAESPGQDDHCPARGAMCSQAEIHRATLHGYHYWTCAGYARYLCDGRGGKSEQRCTAGCTAMGDGHDDVCR